MVSGFVDASSFAFLMISKMRLSAKF